MRALLLNQSGTPYDLELGTAPVPTPKSNEVRIKLKACAVNPVDFKVASAGVEQWTYPHILGLDTAGVVDEVGEGVTGFSLGDRVVQHGDLTRKGGFAEYVVCDTRHLAHIPPSVSFIDAAASMCAGVTAFQALTRKLHIGPGTTILIEGGAGGVGSFAVQIAKALGAAVFTTCCRANTDFAISLGADAVIDYNAVDSVPAEVLRLTDGVGVDRILSTLSPENTVDDLKCLAFNGELCAIVGALPCSIAALNVFPRGQALMHCFLGGAHINQHHASLIDMGDMTRELLEMVAAGTVKARVERVIGLSKVGQALTDLEAGHVRGKIVVDMQE